MKRQGKANATGRNARNEHHVRISSEMIDSIAFQHLGPPALKIYVFVRRHYNGSNNGKLTLSVDEAARRCKTSKGTAHRAFKELVAKGFLVVVRPGQWFNRRAAEYALTDRPSPGSLPTHAYKQWKPGMDFTPAVTEPDMPNLRAAIGTTVIREKREIGTLVEHETPPIGTVVERKASSSFHQSTDGAGFEGDLRYSGGTPIQARGRGEEGTGEDTGRSGDADV